jgi:APA family basic amino acid/polyamine antiporter
MKVCGIDVSALFKTKPLDRLLIESKGKGDLQLRRVLGPWTLTTLGIGAIIGAGIFVLTGSSAANYAGPGIVISFILAGLAALFAAFCYAEFASCIPVAGSAYTYAYATLGRLFAWIIGWDLILEYSMSVALVSAGWSGYFLSFLGDLGISIPPQFSGPPGTHLIWYHDSWHHLERIKSTLEQTMSLEQIAALPHITAEFNLIAFIAIILITILLIIGIKESTNFNNFMVIVKLIVILLFIIIVGCFVISNPEKTIMVNWKNFIPENTGEFGHFGWSGVFRGASIVFFSYIGFDAVSTASQEARSPQKDMPIGIVGSVLICTILYLLVSGLLTAVVPYDSLNVSDPVAVGIEATGIKWGAFLVNIGAIFGLGTVMLVMMLGQSRIFYAMANDGFLPKWTGKVHPKFGTPYISTIIVGIIIAFCGALLPINILGELVSIGTLLTFALVCASILVLRKRYPGVNCHFKTPFVPFVPIAGVVISCLLMLSLSFDTWLRLIIWFMIGQIIFFTFASKRSKY